jgi:hypothetical protein
MDTPVEDEKCMFASNGRAGLASVDRNITLESQPKFKGLEQFLMRDNLVAMSWQAIFGDIDNDDQNNIVCLYLAKKIVTGVTLNNDAFMSHSVTSMAAKDATLGDEYEIVLAAF